MLNPWLSRIVTVGATLPISRPDSSSFRFPALARAGATLPSARRFCLTFIINHLQEWARDLPPIHPVISYERPPLTFALGLSAALYFPPLAMAVPARGGGSQPQAEAIIINSPTNLALHMVLSEDNCQYPGCSKSTPLTTTPQHLKISS